MRQGQKWGIEERRGGNGTEEKGGAMTMAEDWGAGTGLWGITMVRPGTLGSECLMQTPAPSIWLYLKPFSSLSWSGKEGPVPFPLRVVVRIKWENESKCLARCLTPWSATQTLFLYHNLGSAKSGIETGRVKSMVVIGIIITIITYSSMY